MKKKLYPALMMFLLCSCSMTPDYERPSIETPSSWNGASASGETQIAQNWWTTFSSPELNNLMSQALINNNDIRAGLQRIEQSRAGLKIAGASLLPSVGASSGASENRSWTDGESSRSSSLRAGASISYELDLFGSNRANIEGARANLLGTEYSQDALALVVMGDVARGYFNILSARERLRIVDRNLNNAKEILRIVQARVDAGSASPLDLAQQKTSVASNEASRASLVQQITISENALAVLLGKPPQSINVQGQDLNTLTVPEIQPGQPSRLLERRPDIRAAETGLLAANANIGVARAAFFPNLSIGIDPSIAATSLASPATTALSLAASLAMPIFQGGRLEGGVEQATARQTELVENYRKTVLVSFQEVEDTLAAVKAAEVRTNALAIAQDEAQKAYDLSKANYDAGAIDFQTLINTQNSLLNTQDSYAQAKFDRLFAATDLFKALGGGWR